MAWYKTGTITVTNGSTTVSGAGTAWISNAAIGEALYAPDGKLYEITNIASDTTMTIAPAYLGATASAQAYVIVPSQSYIRDLAAQAADLVNNYSTIANNAGVGKFGDGTLGAPGIRFSDDLDTGFFRSASNEVTFVAGGTAIFKYNLTGGLQLSSVNLDGGTIDGTTIGATTRSTGAFTTLTSNGATTFTANTASTTTTTGTAVITGGLGVSGRINAANFDGIVGANTAAAVFSTNLSATSITDSGNLTFTGTGNRIRGDFSSVIADRVAFQSSTTNGQTRLGLIPNGTSTDTAVDLFNNSSDLTNAGRLSLRAGAAEMAILSVREGTGTYLPMTFYTGGSERVRVDTSGNVGIGTASPGYRLDVSQSTNGDGSVQITNANAGTAAIASFRAASSTNTAWFGIGGSSYSGYAQIRANGAAIYTNSGAGIGLSADNSAGYITFGTGSGAPERMRLDSSGNLLVGTTTSEGPSKISSVSTALGTACVGYRNSAGSGSTLAIFINNNNTAVIGSVTNNANTGVLYNTTSDYRLKNITGALTNSGAFIDALKPKVGTWKADGSPFVGFLAHEFQEVSPLSVSGQKDAVDDEGKPKYQSMQASSAEVMANVIAELQSLRKRVAELESI